MNTTKNQREKGFVILLIHIIKVNSKIFFHNSLKKDEKKLILSKRLNFSTLSQFVKIFTTSNKMFIFRGGMHYLMRKPKENEELVS